MQEEEKKESIKDIEETKEEVGLTEAISGMEINKDLQDYELSKYRTSQLKSQQLEQDKAQDNKG